MNQPFIFSASIGHGHNQAAKALRHEFNNQGFEPEIIDTFHAINPYLHKFMLHSYIHMLKVSPLVWRRIYFYAEKHPLFLLLDRFGTLFVEHLHLMMIQKRCPFMISTHPFVTAFLSRMKHKKQVDIPLYTVITDFVLHPAYVRQEIDGYFTASPQVNEFANLYKVPSNRFFSTGIPITKSDSFKKSRRAARCELNLDPNKKTLLIAGGGRGLTNYVKIIRTLEYLKEPIQILCLIGHNHRSKQSIMKQMSKHKIRAIDFTDQFLLYLKASDAIISKAGGLTMSEALACETPIIVFNPVPGHEEQNAQYLADCGAAVKVNGYYELPSILEHVLYDQGYYEKLQHHARILKKPDAANEIVKRMLMLFEQHKKA
ncbi:MGDG synthase family glycosyltransferase [Alteribacter populi]|uniref:MGDG synthase family glycosyltransferase n=1 Tax=Alteribacter populi TaxID=2011011 RepID=UPI000BBA88EB|nr:glycosyltransferase [Alteribacter populi]